MESFQKPTTIVNKKALLYFTVVYFFGSLLGDILVLYSYEFSIWLSGNAHIYALLGLLYYDGWVLLISKIIFYISIISNFIVFIYSIALKKYNIFAISMTSNIIISWTYIILLGFFYKETFNLFPSTIPSLIYCIIYYLKLHRYTHQNNV